MITTRSFLFYLTLTQVILIHSANPVTAVGSLFWHMSSVRPHFSKQNKFQAKTEFATGETASLAEWIIDDTCLVSSKLSQISNYGTLHS